MLTKRIIPCLDVMNGRVVKGVSFVNLRDAGDPVELAKVYNQEGADEITFLDITASYEKRATMLDVVRRTAEQVFIPVTVGGGIRSVEDIRATLGAGADKTSLNTAAVQIPSLLLLARNSLVHSVLCWRSMHARMRRCLVVMKCMFTVVALPQIWMLWSGHSVALNSVQARYC